MEQAKRPETMERITTSELAKAFIEEQIAELRKQVEIKKCCWPCPAAWIRLLWPRC